ncbi:MAG TPA: AI-2E family transporter [Crinalium sp.]
MKFGHWVGLIALLAALFILWKIRQILLLIFVGTIFATALNRLVRDLQRTGIHRSAAVALSAIFFLLILISFMGFVIPSFLNQLEEFIEILPDISNHLRTWLEALQSRIPRPLSNDIHLLDLLNQQTQPFISGSFNHLITLFSDVLTVVVRLILVFVLTIMLLANPQRYRHPVTLVFPAFYRHRIDHILTECEVRLVGWVTGTFVSMLFVSISSGLSLWILGIPLALANALWAGFTELVPNIGWILGLIPALAIALTISPWQALGVAVMYFIIQQIQVYLVVPMVMRERVSLPPAVILLSQLVFASFFGFLGLFLAIPLMIVSRTLLKEILVNDILDHWQSKDRQAKIILPPSDLPVPQDEP